MDGRVEGCGMALLGAEFAASESRVEYAMFQSGRVEFMEYQGLGYRTRMVLRYDSTSRSKIFLVRF